MTDPADLEIELARDGERLGRFSAADILDGLSKGRFQLTDDAWVDGAPAWVKLRDLPVGRDFARQQPLMPPPPMATASRTPAAPAPIQAPPSFTPRNVITTPGSVDNKMVQSILVTLFCCLPLGIVAIINASRVNTLLLAGDRRGAEEASAKAAQYVGYSVIAAVVWWVLYFLVFGAAIASSM